MMLCGISYGANIFTTYTHSRNSTAYLDGTAYNANTIRTNTIYLPSTSTVVIQGNETLSGGGTVAIKPMTMANGVMWGTNQALAGLYKSIDGTNWTEVVAPASLTPVEWVHGLSTGGLLLCKVDNRTGIDSHFSTWYWDGTGACPFANTQDYATAVINHTTNNESGKGGGGIMTSWSFWEAVNGTIVVVEYAATTATTPKGFGLWRSTDHGTSFTREYLYDGSNSGTKHFHAVAKQEATGAWVASMGDGTGDLMLTSADDGDTWTALLGQTTTATEYQFQPVAFLDDGSSNLLYAGEDYSGLVCSIDVKSDSATYKEINSLYGSGATKDNTHVFGLYKYNGIYYASTYLTAGAGNVNNVNAKSVILVSTDLTNWVVYHRFADGENGILRFLGVMGSKIHATYVNNAGTYKHLTFNPVTISAVSGYALDPATTNRVGMTSSRNLYQCTSLEGGTNSWWTGGATGTTPLHGAASYDDVVAGSGSASDYIGSSGDSAITRGVYSTAQLAYKGIGVGYSYCAKGGGDISAQRYWRGNKSRYFNIHYEPTVSKSVAGGDATNSQNNQPTLFYANVAGLGASTAYTMSYDCVQVELGPQTRWQLGGLSGSPSTSNPRVIDNFLYSASLGNFWTVMFVYVPYAQSEHLANFANQYICALTDTGASNKLELYYNTTDNKFYMAFNAGGDTGTTSTYKWYRDQPIRMALTCNGSTLTLHVNTGGAWEHKTIDASSYTWLKSLVKFNVGNAAVDNLLSGTLASPKAFNQWISNSAVENTNFADTTTNGAPKGGLRWGWLK